MPGAYQLSAFDGTARQVGTQMSTSACDREVSAVDVPYGEPSSTGHRPGCQVADRAYFRAVCHVTLRSILGSDRILHVLSVSCDLLNNKAHTRQQRIRLNKLATHVTRLPDVNSTNQPQRRRDKTGSTCLHLEPSAATVAGYRRARPWFRGGQNPKRRRLSCAKGRLGCPGRARRLSPDGVEGSTLNGRKGLDFGLAGKVALVCGSSAGLGRACAIALARAGATVVLNGRNEARLAAAATQLSDTVGVELAYICADVTSEAGRKKLLTECANPDILVNNADGPPMGDFRDLDESAWAAALQTAMVSPIMLIRGVIDGMVDRRWGRIINITSSSAKAPMPLLALSNGGRSGLTGFVAGLAREVAASGVTINNLLPGRMHTDRLREYIQALATSRSVSTDVVEAELLATNPMGRFGDPSELGVFCAFLASQQASYVTGQNLLIDGGEYPGL